MPKIKVTRSHFLKLWHFLFLIELDIYSLHTLQYSRVKLIKETSYMCPALKHSKEINRENVVKYWQHIDRMSEAQTHLSYLKPKAVQPKWKFSMGFAITIFTTQMSSA